jgi:hypothetical protein
VQNLERLARERKQAEALWPSLDELHRNILNWDFGEIDRSNFHKGIRMRRMFCSVFF